MSEEATQKQNTDREIWRGKSRFAEFGDDDNYYADSLFVPQGDVEALGINCGGFVIVKPIREWHALAQQKGEKMPTFEKPNEQGFQEWWLTEGILHMPSGNQPPEHAAIARLAWAAALQLPPSAASEERGLREALEKHDMRRWLRMTKGDGSFGYLQCYCGIKIYEDSNEAMFGHVAAALQSAPSSPPRHYISFASEEDAQRATTILAKYVGESSERKNG